MTVTPETVLAHELIGLDGRVVRATNADLVGVAGRVVDETTNTLRIEGADGRVRTAPKAGATFEFVLDDGEAVVVEGDRLVARPARRTQETMGGRTWHLA